MRARAPRAALAAFLFVAASTTPAPALAQGTDHWVGTWATATVSGAASATPAPQAAQPQAPPPSFNNQTLRQIVRVGLGGERVRVVLTNAFGTTPLTVAATHVALREKGAAIKNGTDRSVTFDGRPAVTIPAGAVVVSDPVSLTVPAFADLAVSIYLPDATAPSPATLHTLAVQTNYVTASGNQVSAPDLADAKTNQNWFYLARIEVATPEPAGAVVTLGDSITDGTRSTPDTNNRWPNHLAKRLAAQGMKMGVMDVGISANRLLSEPVGPAALARFDRDVLAQTGVTHVTVLEGINDIRRTPVTVADLIFAHKQLIARAHAKGLKIFGATLLPFEGDSQYKPETEAKRQGLNQWIRTSGAYDGVIDFDAAVRDPKQPTKILEWYDSGDHLHPNDAGYEAMAAAIDLKIFAGTRQPATASR
ncbi:MAG: SGNH/GDSL hydrolase family protein [Vicinamibacterales bacterium]